MEIKSILQDLLPGDEARSTLSHLAASPFLWMSKAKDKKGGNFAEKLPSSVIRTPSCFDRQRCFRT